MLFSVSAVHAAITLKVLFLLYRLAMSIGY